MDPLIRFFLILVLLLVAFRLFFRYLFPLLAKWFIKRTLKKNFGQYGNEPTRKEGEVHVKTNHQNTPNRKPDDLGEYIDFEEIKDQSNE